MSVTVKAICPNAPWTHKRFSTIVSYSEVCVVDGEGNLESRGEPSPPNLHVDNHWLCEDCGAQAIVKMGTEAA